MPALIWFAGFLLLSLLAGIAYQRVGARRDRSLHPAPGKFVNIGTLCLHLLDEGEGSPTIILEAGLMSTNLSWTGIRRALAESYRVISYDRAGLGWSDTGPMPRTAERIVDELHSLLVLAAIPGPYVLVGHSFGGLTMPLFAARYPEKIAGMVLVDPVVPAEWNPPSDHDLKRATIGAKVCRRAGLLSQVGVIRFVAFLLNSKAKNLASHLVRLLSSGTPADSGTVSSPWFWNLPPNERRMASVFWVQQKFCNTIASQLESLPGSAKRIAELNYLCDKPVIILSAKSTPPTRREQHISISQRLPQGRHILADKSTHWIMQDQPELLLGAIDEVARKA